MTLVESNTISIKNWAIIILIIVKKLQKTSFNFNNIFISD